MPRLTLFLAFALLAAPAAARAQSGGAAPAARPSRAVDECGVPLPQRARRSTPPPAAAARPQPPRLLGVRRDSVPAAAGTLAAGGTAVPAAGTAHGTSAVSGSANGHPDGGTMASSTSAAGHGMASATTGAGPAISPTGTAGTMASSTSSTGAGMASATTGAGSATSPTGTAGTMASSTSSTGPGMASATTGAGSALSPTATPGTIASSTSGTRPGTTAATSGSGAGASAANGGAAAAGASVMGPVGLVDAAGPIDPRAARRNRAALRLGLGSPAGQVRLGPAASVSVPTALGVDAGEMFFGLAYQGRTRYTDQDDGAAVVGIGIGSRRVAALEVALTTYSTFRGAPLETGGLSFKLHRALPRETSVAVGWENAVLWGGSDDDGSLFAVASRTLALRPEPSAPFSTGVVTLGIGNGRFRFEKDDAAGRETVNLFAAAGVRVTSAVSVVADWTGQDLNAAASLTPIRRLPLVATAGLADITGSAGDGARFILALGYGLAIPLGF